MIEKFEKNKQVNPDFEKLSQELTHYLQRKIEKNNPKFARDLKQKLIDGNREFIIETAIESKSKIHRKIAKYGLFKTANEVFLFLLSNTLSIFQYQIKGKILSKEFSVYEIDDFIADRIINPLWEDCQMSSLFDNIDEMYGLLFLLTGNCHIDWDNEL